jgi:hypothetical protein
LPINHMILVTALLRYCVTALLRYCVTALLRYLLLPLHGLSHSAIVF